MKAERIIRALNDVDDIYILESMPGRDALYSISARSSAFRCGSSSPCREL